MSVVNEERVVGAVKLKEGHQLTYRLLQTMVEWPFYKATTLKVVGKYKLRYSLRDQNLTKY